MRIPDPFRDAELLQMVQDLHDSILKTGHRGWFTVRFNYPDPKDMRRGGKIKATVESEGRACVIQGDLTEAT